MGTSCTPAELPVPPADWWPCYFCAEPIRARNFDLSRGQLFPVQRKETVRGYLRSFVPDIDRTPLHRVKLLRVLHVPPKAYLEIIEQNASYDQAVGILRRRTRTQP
jgi:hypothetical protein